MWRESCRPVTSPLPKCLRVPWAWLSSYMPPINVSYSAPNKDTCLLLAPFRSKCCQLDVPFLMNWAFAQQLGILIPQRDTIPTKAQHTPPAKSVVYTPCQSAAYLTWQSAVSPTCQSATCQSAAYTPCQSAAYPTCQSAAYPTYQSADDTICQETGNPICKRAAKPPCK